MNLGGDRLTIGYMPKKKPKIYKSDGVWRVQFGKQNSTWFFWLDARDYVLRNIKA